MNPIPLNLVFEDPLSECVMRKMTESTAKFYVANTYSEGGFGYIKKNMKGWNEAAKGCAFFVLTDLDRTDCAPALRINWLREAMHSNLIFRVAVKEVEAWLLADKEGFAKYIGVPTANFPEDIESVSDPKLELFRLVKRCRKRSLKEDILPKDEFASIGPNYNGHLCDFVSGYWNINRAIERSDSLKRALNHLRSFNMTL